MEPKGEGPDRHYLATGVHSLGRAAEAGKITTERAAASIESYLAGLLTCTETPPRP
jgi:hypothetical protein